MYFLISLFHRILQCSRELDFCVGMSVSMCLMSEAVLQVQWACIHEVTKLRGRVKVSQRVCVAAVTQLQNLNLASHAPVVSH